MSTRRPSPCLSLHRLHVSLPTGPRKGKILNVSAVKNNEKYYNWIESSLTCSFLEMFSLDLSVSLDLIAFFAEEIAADG